MPRICRARGARRRSSAVCLARAAALLPFLCRCMNVALRTKDDHRKSGPRVKKRGCSPRAVSATRTAWKDTFWPLAWPIGDPVAFANDIPVVKAVRCSRTQVASEMSPSHS
jgi:hypothetical protein